MKKTNNKGFSLVELIIVIAIMAILAGAIAPALIKYIDKSRKSNDVSSAKTIKTAIETALGTESVYEVLTNCGTSYTKIIFKAGTATPATDTSTPATARTADTAYSGTATNMTISGCQFPTGSTITGDAVEYAIASNIGEKMPKTKYQKTIDQTGKKVSTGGFKPETFFAVISSGGTVYVGVTSSSATGLTFSTSQQAVTAGGASLTPTVCDGYQ